MESQQKPQGQSLGLCVCWGGGCSLLELGGGARDMALKYNWQQGMKATKRSPLQWLSQSQAEHTQPFPVTSHTVSSQHLLLPDA